MPFRIEDHTGVLIKKAARLFEQVANRDLDKFRCNLRPNNFSYPSVGKRWAKSNGTCKKCGLKTTDSCSYVRSHGKRRIS